MKKLIQETVVLVTLGLSTLRARLGASLVIVVGSACVVAVLLAMLSMSNSVTRTMVNAGSNDRAIVLQKNARSESDSLIARDALVTIQNAGGIRRIGSGSPLLSSEALFAFNALKKSDGLRTELLIRGVSGDPSLLRPEIRVITGRLPQPGKSELVVGRAAQGQYRGLDVGDTVRFRGGAWQIVGVFESGQSARESELLGDVDSLLSSVRRTAFNSVTVQLDNAAALQQFRSRVENDPSVSLSVFSEAEYYELQSRRLGNILRLIAYLVGAIMAAGAVFGALNTMYSAVSTRSTEIATLRAIGFKSVGIVVSILSESLTLALLGALIGASVVWWFCNGLAFSTRPGGGYHLVVQMKLDGALVATGVVWAIVIAFIGGLAPALRAASMPLASALREK